MLIEKRKFTGGMDGDTNPRELPENVMLNLMNARVSVTEYGRTDRVETVPGTTQTTNNSLTPGGANQCIGGCKDEARNRIIFFICNTLSTHGIYCYDIANDITYAVLYDSQVTGGLGFTKTSRIDRNCNVVGDILYWTDNLNPLRRINIEAGIKTNHPSYSTTVSPYTNPIDQSVISLIRRPPGTQPASVKNGSSASTLLNPFAGKFAVRYIYRDGEESVFGVPSQMINVNATGDTSEYVTVGWGTFSGEPVPQDVQIIEFAVSYGNDPDYFVFKSFNKANAADLAIINAFNANTGPLQTDFYNDINGTAVGNANSVKPSDTIPLICKTLEIAINRLFLANYTKGYNVPTTTSLTGALTNVSFGQSMKKYSSYQIGIVFRDFYKRKSSVVTNSNLVITIPDRTYADTLSTNNMIAWTLSNATPTIEIPDWAYYYDIVITKNLRTRFFMQAKASVMKYVIKAADGTLTYQDAYISTAYGIAIGLSTLTAQGMGYIFNDGDQCRLYMASPAATYPLSILSQEGNYVIVQLANLGNFVAGTNAFFELYTPYSRLESESFYTSSRSFPITNPTTISRQYSTTSGTFQGDIYAFNRPSVNCEAMSPNDTYWKDYLLPYGDATQVSLLGQKLKGNFVQWSNVLIVGSQTNGLSTFDALDEKAIPIELGSINKLQLTNKISDMGQGNVMLAICPTETASLYLGETQVMGASQSAFVSQSTDVIGSINVLTGSLGTMHPESVIGYLGNVFWFDVLNGCFAQYSPNGLEQVSRYKMSRFFKRYSKDYLAANNNNLDNINGFHHIPTGIDPFHKEVVCGLPGLIYSNYANTLPSYSSVPSFASSIINRFDIYDQLKKDMCFMFEDNKWSSNFNYGAEFYINTENKFFGFKDGGMWQHNVNTTNWNTFYGIQQPMRICLTGNLNSSLMKVLNNIAIEGDGVIPNFVVALTAVPNQQISDLANTDTINGELSWTVNEGVVERAFLADRLSPNVSGTADEKLYSGDSLRDFSIFVMCEWQKYDGLLYINFINLGYSESKAMQNIVNTVNK